MEEATKQPSSEELLEELRGKLAEARATYDGGKLAPLRAGERAIMHRLGARQALMAVSRFLTYSRFPRADLQPLIDIEAAFVDHREGKPNALFASEKKAGRSTHSQVSRFRAEVANAITRLIEDGEKKTTAVKRVADVLTKVGIPNATAKQVASWHREISGERANSTAVKFYKFIRSCDTDERMAPYLPTTEDMLRQLPNSAPPEEL